MAGQNTNEVEPGDVNHSDETTTTSLPPPPPTQPVNGVQVDEQQPLRVLVFDTQSTCSQLFSKSLSNYLRLGQIHHPYVIAATLGPDRIHTKIGNEQTRRLWEGRVAAAPARVKSTRYEHATNDLLRQADRLEKRGKTLFVTESAPFVLKHEIMSDALRSHETIVSRLSNPTVIPDELIKLFTPIIFIQHPAITIPAWIRLAKEEYGSYYVDDDDFTMWTSLRWVRIMFDYLRSTNHLKREDSVRSRGSSVNNEFGPRVIATKPYVVDAADVANNPHETLSAICRLLDIKIDDVTQSWTQYFSRASELWKKVLPSSIMKSFAGTAYNPNNSKKVYEVHIDTEMEKWRTEFGNDVAEVLRKKVEEDMPHYDYLKNFKLRILPSLNTNDFLQNITGMPVRRQSALPPTAKDREIDSVGHPLRIIRSAVDGTLPSRESSLSK